MDAVACDERVTGSRHARRTFQRACDCVLRDGWHIIVGDPVGVDCRAVAFRRQGTIDGFVAVAFGVAAICGGDWVAPFDGARRFFQRRLMQTWPASRWN